MTRGGKAATHGHPRALGAVDTCDKTFCASRKSSIANKPAAGRERRSTIYSLSMRDGHGIWGA